MIYGDKENAKKKLKLDAENYDRAAAICEQLIHVVKQFDGKVLNVRFKKALKEYTGYRFNVDFKGPINQDGDSGLSIDWYVEDDYVEGAGYVSIKEINLCYKPSSSNDNLIVNKRINADNIIENINECKEEILLKAKEIRHSIEKVDEWCETYHKIQREIDNYNDDMLWIANDYLKIKFYCGCFS